MGSYAYLKLAGYPLASTKHFVDPTAMMLFTEQDKRIHMPEPGEVVVDAENDEEYDATPEVEYVASLAVVRDRLEFMGYTLAKIQQEFKECVSEHIEETINHIEYASNASSPTRELLLPKYQRELEVLQTITFDDWLTAMDFIFRGKHYPHYRAAEENPDFPPLVRFLLSESPGEGVWTPFYDFRSSVRAVIEVVGIEHTIRYDLSELVASEEMDIDADLCAWARRQTADEFVLNHKVVILTEGKSDTWCIEGALQILFPHLTDYYSFMDFDVTRVEGGAGALVSVIKAFVGAGIVNRVIGLFDNDTAARAALRGLRAVKLPANVRLVHLPDVDWARRYPTLGPQGMVEMDVNGLAGGIELYFGLDVLRQDDGTLMPVQWRGYEMALGQYQGEVMNKDRLKERYSQKLAECRRNPDAVAQFDWTGMRAVIDAIRSAFH